MVGPSVKRESKKSGGQTMITWIDVPVEVRVNQSTVEVIVDGKIALLVEEAKSVTIVMNNQGCL